MTKVCSSCKEERSVSDFSKDRTRNDGLRSQCRDCVREQDRKYRKKNLEKLREQSRKYQKENPDYFVSKAMENRRKKNEVSTSMATKSGRWSQEEVDLLIELRKTRTVYQCSIELGRAFESTRSKVERLRKDGVEI